MHASSSTPQFLLFLSIIIVFLSSLSPIASAEPNIPQDWDVSGHVTIDGESVGEGIIVTLSIPLTGENYSATTDADGYYSLQYSQVNTQIGQLVILQSWAQLDSGLEGYHLACHRASQSRFIQNLDISDDPYEIGTVMFYHNGGSLWSDFNVSAYIEDGEEKDNSSLLNLNKVIGETAQLFVNEFSFSEFDVPCGEWIIWNLSVTLTATSHTQNTPFSGNEEWSGDLGGDICPIDGDDTWDNDPPVWVNISDPGGLLNSPRSMELEFSLFVQLQLTKLIAQYDTNTGNFTGWVPPSTGNNLLIITASDPVGSTKNTMVITWT